ncbi:hypothetical protein ACOXXX_05870 [Thalassococcus sp. BH17M4-6]|uniref:hypothetical protein n=1 Tax=Thalassococcus sp. BH17M4-6 TaxID=3413148 RepID=UPI003BE131C0
MKASRDARLDSAPAPRQARAALAPTGGPQADRLTDLRDRIDTTLRLDPQRALVQLVGRSDRGPLQRVISTKLAGDGFGRKTTGNQQALAAQVTATIASNDRDEASRDIATLEASIQQRQHEQRQHPSGTSEYASHAARIAFEQQQLQRLRTAKAAMPRRPRAAQPAPSAAAAASAPPANRFAILAPDSDSSGDEAPSPVAAPPPKRKRKPKIKRAAAPAPAPAPAQGGGLVGWLRSWWPC